MKHIKVEIELLFDEMKDYIKENGIDKQFSHRGRGNKDRYFSKNIGIFRLKALEISRENTEWSKEEKMYFSQTFGRKTTPYYWCKKEL